MGYKMQKNYRKKTIFFSFIFLFLVLHCTVGISAAESEPVSITVNYSNVSSELQTITVEFCDDWLLQPDDVYNHKLMQASFVMAVTGFRSKIYDLSDKDHDIRDFFTKAGFTGLRSDDFNRLTTINTIGTMIAHKKAGDETLIAVSISGNNYQNEWLSNFTIDDEIRPAGFNSAAAKVMQRVDEYIKEYQLTGSKRLWVSGYSRAAAVSNIFAADAVNSKKFQAVYAYTFATPRTTRDRAPERYHNIFNLINPEDVVPLIPFPEWGYERYGTDLFLPSITTDSGYDWKFAIAVNETDYDDNDQPVFNPRMRRELHTVMDYIAYFVNSSEFYTHRFQKILIQFWEYRSFKTLFNSIKEQINIEAVYNYISHRHAVFMRQLYEFYNFLDFNASIVYRSFFSNKFGSEDDYWDSSLSLQENIAYGHYDKTYRFWLFSPNAPEDLFTKDPDYLHYTILGDVDVEMYDEQGNLMEVMDRDGWFGFELDEELYNPDFHGDLSETIVYAERLGNMSMIELPGDQKYTIYIHSNTDQDLRVSTVEYSAERLKADVLYIYNDHYDKGEEYPEPLDPAREKDLTDEFLETVDNVQTVKPWSEDVTYSPTAVMRLENPGAFLPKTLRFMIIAHIVINMLLAGLIIVFIKLLRLTVRFTVKKVTGKELPVYEDLLELPEAKKQQLAA